MIDNVIPFHIPIPVGKSNTSGETIKELTSKIMDLEVKSIIMLIKGIDGHMKIFTNGSITREDMINMCIVGVNEGFKDLPETVYPEWI